MQLRNDNNISEFVSKLQEIVERAVAAKIKRSEVNRCLDDIYVNGTFSANRTYWNFVCVQVTNILVFCSIVYLAFSVLYRFPGMPIQQVAHAVESFVDSVYDEYTYTAMRTARFLILPVLTRYPSISRYHDVKCLVPNPLYSPLDESNCWPCENLKALIDLSGHGDVAKECVATLTPFVVQDATTGEPPRGTFYQVLQAHEQLLNDPTSKFQSSVKEVQELRHLLKEKNQQLLEEDKTFQITWQLSSSTAARTLRKAFRRPYFVPNNTEVALRRCFLIDGPQAPSHFFPETDFTNAWLMQVEGTRIVVLEPSSLCSARCGTVSVLMKPKHVLYFNSQISRPRSVPSQLPGTPSVAYLGSFY